MLLVFRRYVQDVFGNFRRTILTVPAPTPPEFSYRVYRRYGKRFDGTRGRRMDFFKIGPPVTNYVGVHMAFSLIRSAGMSRGRIR